MIRAVLDTNVIVSALVFRKRLFPVVLAVDAGQLRFVASLVAIEEYVEVLLRFGDKTPDYEGNLRSWLHDHCDIVVPTIPGTARCRDPDDDFWIEIALAGRAPLVSGDHDLQVLSHTISGLTVMTPGQLLDLLGREAGKSG